MIDSKIAALVLLLAARGASVAAAEPLVQATAAAGQSPYSLQVTNRDGLTAVSLTADRAKLSQVAQDLARRLNAQVFVGPSMLEEVISANLADTPLDAAVGTLAPRAFIDYEMRRGANPVPLGIYLLGLADPTPAVNAVVRGSSQGVLITGNTEDTGKPAPNDPLRIIVNNGRLSITSKQQPLAVIALAVGESLGVPVDLNYEATELLDADVFEAAPDQAVLAISPNVRAYVRVDVNRYERTLLRLVVGQPLPK